MHVLCIFFAFSLSFHYYQSEERQCASRSSRLVEVLGGRISASFDLVDVGAGRCIRDRFVVRVVDRRDEYDRRRPREQQQRIGKYLVHG